jgi:7,8-dihydropterin-6-yl-methyl-4-(beta-D-ribofuranosyl)aminobenzene 5'-phosphate synthase
MMHLTVLVDNHTQVGTPFRGESGLSYLLEVDGKKILFDTGSSDLFLHNAKAMNLEVSDIDFVVLSHGHGDHTGGLEYLLGVTESQRPKLVTHPLSVVEKQMNGQQFGMTLPLEKLKEAFDLVLSATPVWISEHLVFLGEIPRRHLFENQESLGERIEGDNPVPDNLLDDSALAVRTEKGLFIITGCSHAGICNIIDYAREVCQESRIIGVVGGFHVFKADDRTQKTAEFLKASNITNLYPCHCTGFKAKALINEIVPIGDVSVGTRLDLN